jgi:hypothetical protein
MTFELHQRQKQVFRCLYCIRPEMSVLCFVECRGIFGLGSMTTTTLITILITNPTLKLCEQRDQATPQNNLEKPTYAMNFV